MLEYGYTDFIKAEKAGGFKHFALDKLPFTAVGRQNVARTLYGAVNFRHKENSEKIICCFLQSRASQDRRVQDRG